MAAVKKKCQLPDCSRAASTLCFCCHQNVCTRHFIEHIEAVKAQIDPLVNDINEMVQTVQGLAIEELKEKSLVKLRQWQSDMHILINNVFDDKCKDVENLCASNQEKFIEFRKEQLSTVINIQDDVRQLAEDGDATMEQIQSLKNQLKSLKNNISSCLRDFLVVEGTVLPQLFVTVSSSFKQLSSGGIKPARQTAREPEPSSEPEISQSLKFEIIFARWKYHVH